MLEQHVRHCLFEQDAPHVMPVFVSTTRYVTLCFNNTPLTNTNKPLTNATETLTPCGPCPGGPWFIHPAGAPPPCNINTLHVAATSTHYMSLQHQQLTSSCTFFTKKNNLSGYTFLNWNGMLERKAKECTGKECTGTATLVRTGNPSHAEALLQPSRPTSL